VIRLVEDAVAKGALVECGGASRRGWKPAGSMPHDPDRLHARMDMMHEEIFGPVVAIVRVPDFDEADRPRQRQPLRPWRLDLHHLARRGDDGGRNASGRAWSGSTTR
jgi:hypothetical protein